MVVVESKRRPPHTQGHKVLSAHVGHTSKTVGAAFPRLFCSLISSPLRSLSAVMATRNRKRLREAPTGDGDSRASEELGSSEIMKASCTPTSKTSK